MALFIALVALLGSIIVQPASAGPRVALVIGNSAYTQTDTLRNPATDAALIASALRKSGFTDVDVKLDLGIAALRKALRDFQSLADRADIAFIYFAGHGIEAAGSNWLIPTDARLSESRDLEYEAVRIELVLNALSGARIRVLALDACRNNPFGRNWGSGTRSVSNGLRGHEADDVLVLFAASPGATASDGDGGINSPFAISLARNLPAPGIPIQLLGGRVRDAVLQMTNGKQRPYVSASMTGEPFYLMPTAVPQAGNEPSRATDLPPLASPPAARGAPTEDEARVIWDTVKDSKDQRLLEVFAQRYPNSFYAELAKSRLMALREPAPSPLPQHDPPQMRQVAPPATPAQPLEAAFDGSWYSPEWKYGYQLRNGVGIATSTNSANFSVGQPIIRIRAVNSTEFVGEQVYRTGRWHRIRGVLRGGRLYIDGDKDVSWYMIRQ